MSIYVVKSLRRGYKPTSTSILIDRRTIFGNPFVLYNESDREKVCSEHQHWLDMWLDYHQEINIGKYSNKEVIENLHLLKNKDLLCWCAPKQCHGDYLLKLMM